MPRPDSFKAVYPDKSCGLCKHCALPQYKDHALCLFGDDVKVTPIEDTGEAWIELDGEPINLIDGSDYDKIWGSRVVHFPDTSVCDNFERDENAATVDATRCQLPLP